MLRELDKRDTLLLKGLAISAIVFHNFFHLISPAGQNEFTFNAARFWTLLNCFKNPLTAIEGLFSFFGHFGVGIFVFLSAYGLAKSHWDDPAPWARFLWGRIKKLYPAVGLVVIPWFVFIISQNGLAEAFSNHGVRVLWMALGVSNLIPGYGLPPVGPWWFIPFVIQLYALFPLIRCLTNRFGQQGLLAISAACIVIIFIAHPRITEWSMTMLDTPIGRMPQFCLGIIAARYPLRLDARLIVPAAAALLRGGVR